MWIPTGQNQTLCFTQFLHPTVQLIPVAVTGAPTRFPTNQKQGEGVAGGEVGKDCPPDFLPSTGTRLPAFIAAVTEASESRA